jgi:hypothetical protein
MAMPSILSAVERALHSFRGSHFLGLDVSVSSTGIVLLDSRGALVHASSSRVPRGSSFLTAGAAISSEIALATRARHVAATTVEDFLQTFSADSSSSATRFALARVNGVAMYEAWRHTRAPVVAAFSTSMRSYFGLERAVTVARTTAAALPFDAGMEGSAAAATAENRSRARARATSRAATKAAIIAFTAETHPYLLERGVTDDATDVADAALTAMYGLAQEVEWRVLNEHDGGLFWEVVDAALPRARVGRGGVLDEGARPAVRAAISELHKTAISAGVARRSMPALTLEDAEGEGGGGDAAQGSGGAEGTAPRKRSKRAVAAAAVAVPVSVSASALKRLYARLRAAFSADVRDALIGEAAGKLPWRAPQKQRIEKTI